MKYCSTALAILLFPVGLIAQQGSTKQILTPAQDGGERVTVAAPLKNGPGPVDASEYIIGPEDNIQVTVWKEPGISSALPVRPDGMITLALIGDMRAAGATPMQLANEISERLKKFIQDPNVTVSVVSVHPKQVFVLGEAQHVGPVIMIPGMTLLQAISAAGGLTPFADAKHVYILRGDKGKQQKIPFDYKKAVKEGNQQGVSLVAGDTIVIP